MGEKRASERKDRYLIFIRHAHRNTEQPQADNGLSDKGKSQVKSLKKYFQRRWGPQLSRFRYLTSPKRRCIETLSPVADAGDRSLEMDPLLLELAGPESATQLSRRTQDFLTRFNEGEGDWVCCSHGDWIPEMVRLLEGCPIQIKKAGVIVFKQSENGPLRMVEMITQWKAFSTLL